MNTGHECERMRFELMAALDGERGLDPPGHHQHLAGCASCRQWLERMQSMSERFSGLHYEDDSNSLWPAVASRIRPAKAAPALRPELWVIAGMLMTWRAMHLAVDLPIAVHAAVSLAATLGVIWLAAGNLLKIETWAPELQK